MRRRIGMQVHRMAGRTACDIHKTKLLEFFDNEEGVKLLFDDLFGSTISTLPFWDAECSRVECVSTLPLWDAECSRT